MPGNGAERVRFGPYEADLHTHELWKFGLKAKLVGQPFEVLAILLSKPGQLVTREELRDLLWPGDTYVDFNHGLNAAVNRLREALCDSAEAPKYVETLPRRGYRFIAAIESGAESEIPSGVVPAGIAAGGVVPEIKTVAADAVAPPAARASLPLAFERGASGSSLGLRRALWAGGVLLLILAVAGLFALKALVHKALARAEAESAAPVQKIRPLTTLTDETNEPALSSDGNFVAFRREGTKPENSGIFVKGIASDELVQLTNNPGDGFPVWSPDGQVVAFSRGVQHEGGREDEHEEFEIYTVGLAKGQARLLYKKEQALNVTIGGEEERKVDSGGVRPTHGALDWSPDGKTLALSSGGGIFLVSLTEHTMRRLTEAPPLAEDWGPAFSPDGKRVLFARTSRAAATQDIMVVETGGGEAAVITSDPAGILSPPRWASDGRTVIFGSARGSHPGLWRAPVDTSGVDTPGADASRNGKAPVEINDGGWYPSIARKGYRMVYQRATRGLNIWELDLSSPSNRQRILVPSTSQTDQGPGPQFSPDGKKLVYMSDRSGTMEIWVCDRDGSNPMQLTALGDTGTPRWSPDSQWIAFDRRGTIYVVNVAGGAPRLVVAPDSNGTECPSWSADGKWVYFASGRTQELQVWKAPAEGGEPVQVTFQGGHAALASRDGKYIYYAKTHYADPEIWQVPVGGGVETQVSPLVRPPSWASWAVVERGILFAGPSGHGRPVVNFFDFATHKVTSLGVMNIAPFWLGASRDGKTVVFDQPGSEQDQVMLVENFR